MLKNLKITNRLALLYTLYMTIFLFVFCTITTYFYKDGLMSEFDQTIAERFSYLERHLEKNTDKTVYFRGANSPNQVEIKDANTKAHVEVWDDSGRMVFKNSSLPLDTPKQVLMTSITTNSFNLRMMTKKTVDGYIIKAAFSQDRVNTKVTSLVYLFLILAPIGIIVIGITSLFFVRSSLRPIKMISEKARIYSSDNLSDRLDIINEHDEIGELSLVLNDLLDRLGSSFKSLKQFTSDASHELRTPLTAIKALCETSLQSKNPNQNYKETVVSVAEEVCKMTDLVDSLLTLARGDSGIFKPTLKKTNLNDIVHEAKNILMVIAEEKRQNIFVESEDVHLMVDPVLLRQALMGLLHNAIKYAPEDSNITISLRRNDTDVLISVLDQGPGIASEHVSNIFKRFYKIHSARSGGTGLGLSIVKWISDLHGGKISYTKVAPSGSNFCLSLPINP